MTPIMYFYVLGPDSFQISEGAAWVIGIFLALIIIAGLYAFWVEHFK